jgi:nitrite reductase (NO-forming)/hydroxylamine reductase
VQELKMPGAGNLFVKTHPKSKNFWADAPMNPERELAEAVFVFDKADLKKAGPSRRCQGFGPAREQGDPSRGAAGVQRGWYEVWISLWGGKTDQSAIVDL